MAKRDPMKTSRPGRPAVDGAQRVRRVNITVEDDQHAFVKANGGSAFVRGLINAAMKSQSKAPKD